MASKSASFNKKTMTTLFVVDVEADGPCPGLYSMVSFAAVRVQRGPLDCFFHGETAPLTDRFVPSALASCHMTRERHESFEAAPVVIERFAQWLKANSDGEPKFVSDNPAFDWQFINYYLHAFTGDNPFGHSARRIGDLWAGIQRNFRVSSVGWRKLRRTKHTHMPLDDARGCAEALVTLDEQFGLNLPYPKAQLLATAGQ